VYRAFADKLLDLTERHAEEIARQWCKSVRTNPRTASYHSLPEEESYSRAVSWYRNIRRVYLSENPYQEMLEYFTKYAEATYAEGIPLHECVYALVIMRRHIWLFAELHALFISSVDLHQATESINRVVLLFDYAIFIVTQKYEEMTK